MMSVLETTTFDRHEIVRVLEATLAHYQSQPAVVRCDWDTVRTLSWFGRDAEHPCQCIEGSMLVVTRNMPRVCFTSQERRALDLSDWLEATDAQNSAKMRLRSHPAYRLVTEVMKENFCHLEEAWVLYALHDSKPLLSVEVVEKALEKARAAL